MFGTLVLVLPTPHKGGALILRHDDKQWAFDSGKEISESPDPKTHIGYVAFFSDVEHEVNKVRAGYRITLTYNLYRSASSVPRSPTDHQSHLKSVLSKLLNDSSFLPEGGHLGFGLQREYPLPVSTYRETLSQYNDLLKGSDAKLMAAAVELSLKAKLNLFYKSEYVAYDGVLCEFIPRDGGELEEDFVHYLWESLDGKRIGTLPNDDEDVDEDERADMEVEWVTEAEGGTRVKSTYIAYGNEASLNWEYGHLCLIVHVGPYGNRSTSEKD